MKKILLAVGLLASTLTFGQVNQPGTIHLGLGWMSTLGGADFTTTVTDPNGESESGTSRGIGAKSGFGVRAGYGIAEKLSVGVYLRTEKAAYVSTDIFSTGSLFISGVAVGLEGKFYLVNKDKFALYAGPQVGFSTGKAYYTGDTEKDKASGLNYAVLLGLNWYWTDFIGMSFDLGYGGGSLKSTGSEDDWKWETKIKNGGVTWGLGLVSKFGGK